MQVFISFINYNRSLFLNFTQSLFYFLRTEVILKTVKNSTDYIYKNL